MHMYICMYWCFDIYEQFLFASARRTQHTVLFVHLEQNPKSGGAGVPKPLGKDYSTIIMFDDD